MNTFCFPALEILDYLRQSRSEVEAGWAEANEVADFLGGGIERQVCAERMARQRNRDNERRCWPVLRKRMLRFVFESVKEKLSDNSDVHDDIVDRSQGLDRELVRQKTAGKISSKMDLFIVTLK